MKPILFAALFLAACAHAPETVAAAGCPPAGYDRARLLALKSHEFAVADDDARNALARALTSCLASTDPPLRDVPYEALQHWMRAGTLSDDTLLVIGDDLQARLHAPEGAGVERPFAALVLAEFARTDRIRPWLTPARRASLLDASIAFLTSVRDYRGFDEHDGWRHNVAHGADLMLQLSLNPAFSKPELTRIRDAIATQIAPPGHFFIYGEDERLAGATIYLAQRGVFSEAEWTAWLAAIAAPAPYSTWDQAYASQAGIARAHDVKAFVFALFINARLDQNQVDDALLPGLDATIRALP